MYLIIYLFIWVPPCLFSTHPGPGEHHVPCFLRNACWLTTGEGGGGGGKEGWGWSKSPCPTTSSGYSPASSIIADPHSLWMSRYNATWLRNQRSQCSPLPPLTPLPPPPPCQKPPPPWSLFIISVGCDLPKRGEQWQYLMEIQDRWDGETESKGKIEMTQSSESMW